MNKQLKTWKAATIGFGAAMASIYSTPELQADIVDINFSPASVPYGGLSSKIDMNTGGNIGFFVGTNSSVSFRNLHRSTVTSGMAGLQSWAISSLSNSIAPGTFSGQSAGFNFNSTSTGNVFVAFRANDGNLGWFSLNLGTAGVDPITFLNGEFGNAGESLHVGGTSVVPEPSGFAGLATLAFGFAGVRRNRKRKSKIT